MSCRPPAPALAMAAALLAAACAIRPPAAPDLAVASSHRAGGALDDGPQGDAAGRSADAPADALALTIEWLWLPGATDAGLVPAGVHALTMAGSGGDDAFTAVPRLVESVRVALGEPARDVAARLRELRVAGSSRLLEQHDALPVGVTAVLTPGPLALELSRPTATSGVELALVRDGTVPLGAVRESDADEAGADAGGSELDAELAAERSAPVAWREVLLLDTNLQPEGPPAVIALPGGVPGASLVALIEVRAAPVEAEALARHAALLAQCLDDVVQSAERQAERAAAMDAVESKHRQLLAAARSMAEAGDRRRACVFLAAESGATLALDTVLACDSAVLDNLAAAWSQAGGPDDEALVAGDTLPWTLERTTALWLAQRAEAAAIPAELEAVMLRETGVLARSPGLLQQAAEESDGVQAWRERVELENRLALEDSLPAWRVRGFDWLAARGLAPPGYDPLGPREERQAALLAADEAP